MGRLIDIDVLFDYFGNDAIDETTRSNIEYFVSEKGTVEAISKDEYENRLRADMFAMLTEIQLEIEEQSLTHSEDNILSEWGLGYNHSVERCGELIQTKINSLKSESEAEDGNND